MAIEPATSAKRASSFPTPPRKREYADSELGLGSVPHLTQIVGLDNMLLAQEDKDEARKILHARYLEAPSCFTLSRIFCDYSLSIEERLGVISKIAGHVFSIRGVIPLKASHYREQSYGGFDAIVAFSFLLSQLEGSAGQAMRLDEQDRDWIIKALRSCIFVESTTEAYWGPLSLRIREESETVWVFATGHKNHQTYVVIWSHFLFLCNRGEDRRDTSKQSAKKGVTVYKSPNRQVFTEESIRAMVERHQFTSNCWPDSRWLEEKFHLSRQMHISMAQQKMGNCTWVSAKTLLRTLLAIRFSSNVTMDQAFFNTKLCYKRAMDQVRMTVETEIAYEASHSRDSYVREVSGKLLDEILNRVKKRR